MLNINEIKLGTAIKHNGQPYVVIAAQHVKMGRGGANLKTKLKNLITGQNLEITYSGGDKAEEADLERTKANFLYKDGSNCFFMDNSTFEQFELAEEVIGQQSKFLKDGMPVEVLVFQNKPACIKAPIKVELEVKETPPGIKGDTAGSAMKIATLETGAEIKVPLFVNQGDVIRVNTETEEYVERVK